MAKPLPIEDRPINLTQVLKRAGLAENGGQAKALIAEGRVRVNGEVETRKRRQMAIGDTVEVEGEPPLKLAQEDAEKGGEP
jgi:ribosome-associated protein